MRLGSLELAGPDAEQEVGPGRPELVRSWLTEYVAAVEQAKTGGG